MAQTRSYRDAVNSANVRRGLAVLEQQHRAAKTIPQEIGTANKNAVATARRLTSAIAPEVRASLAHANPGAWISDHYAEASQFTGWNYLAVHSLCKQAMSARVSVYMSEDEPVGALKRLQFERGSRKSLIGEDNLVPVPTTDRFVKLLRNPSGNRASQSGASFRYERLQQLLMTGSAIVWHLRNQYGLTLERYVLPTAVCKPFDPIPGYPRGGFYVEAWNWRGRVGDAEGFVDTIGYNMAIGRMIPAEDLLIVRLPHPMMRGDGCSTTSAIGSWIDSAGMVDQCRWAHLKNGPGVSMLVSPPKDVPFETDAEMTAFQRRINQQLCGPNNHGKVAVATFENAEPMTQTAVEMAYKESFDQLGKAIMAAYNVSPAAVGMQDTQTYGALAAALKYVTTLGLQPLLDLIAEEETVQMAPEFGDGYVVDYECARVDDPELQERQLSTDIQAQAITVGEVRTLRGRDLFGDERDDKIAGSQSGGASTFGGFQNYQAGGAQAAAAGGIPGASLPGGIVMPDAGAAAMSDEAAKRFSRARKTFGGHSYGCLMAMLSRETAEEILQQAGAIPPELLAADGIETQPHVTIKYGLITLNPRVVGRVVEPCGPISLTLGKVDYFPANPDDPPEEQADVLYYAIESPDCIAMNAVVCSRLPHVNTQREYVPHLTIAYVKPGTAEQFIGEWTLTGRTETITALTFSNTSDQHFVLPLTGGMGRVSAKKRKGKLSTFDRLAVSAAGNGNGHHGDYP